MEKILSLYQVTEDWQVQEKEVDLDTLHAITIGQGYISLWIRSGEDQKEVRISNPDVTKIYISA